MGNPFQKATPSAPTPAAVAPRASGNPFAALDQASDQVPLVKVEHVAQGPIQAKIEIENYRVDQSSAQIGLAVYIEFKVLEVFTSGTQMFRTGSHFAYRISGFNDQARARFAAEDLNKLNLALLSHVGLEPTSQVVWSELPAAIEAKADLGEGKTCDVVGVQLFAEFQHSVGKKSKNAFVKAAFMPVGA